jgi:hypothetical protein
MRIVSGLRLEQFGLRQEDSQLVAQAIETTPEDRFPPGNRA